MIISLMVRHVEANPRWKHQRTFKGDDAWQQCLLRLQTDDALPHARIQIYEGFSFGLTTAVVALDWAKL